MADDMCDIENLCFEQIDGNWMGVVVEVVVAVYSFVGIAIVADEHLTSSLETLCHRWKIPDDVAGASFLALGSAAPEILIASVSTVKSIYAASHSEGSSASFANSLGISSIIGSGMLAFTLIPGLCAMAVPRTMELTRRPLARDALTYLVSLGMLHYYLLRGKIDATGAFAMLALYGVYLLGTAFAPSVREWYRVSVAGMPSKASRASTAPMELGGAADLGERLQPTSGAAAGDDDDDDDDDDDEPTGLRAVLWAPFKPLHALLSATCPACEVDSPTEARYPLTLVVAFGWLALFSAALAAAVTRWGEMLEVPAATMGVFVISVGAQIPDTVQAVAVARRGHGSMAVASAVGSQVINVLIGLGAPWACATGAGIKVKLPENGELIELVYLMYACVAVYLLVLLAPTLPTWGREGSVVLGRTQGWILFGAYAVIAGGYAVQIALHRSAL